MPVGKMDSKTAKVEILPLAERLEKRDKHLRIAVVKDNPRIGQVTVDEFFSFDPEREGDRTYAAAAWVVLFSSEGRFTKEQLVHECSEDEIIDDEETEKSHIEYPPEKVANVTATIDNLIKAGLFEIRNGRVYSNMEMIRG